MPQSRERKREYNRERNRRLRGYQGARVRTRGEGGGGVGGLLGGVVPNVVPEQEDVVPSLAKRRLWGWHKYLVERNEALQATMTMQGKQIRSTMDRTTQLEADLARLEAMMDSMLAERWST